MILTEAQPNGTPLHLFSTPQAAKVNVLTYAGKSAAATYKVTLKYTHDRFEFDVTHKNADGSKLMREHALITLVRKS